MADGNDELSIKLKQELDELEERAELLDRRRTNNISSIRLAIYKTCNHTLKQDKKATRYSLVMYFYFFTAGVRAVPLKNSQGGKTPLS